MPFLGKQPTAGFSSIVKDDLTADGSTTAFTLSKQVANANDIAVFVGNVRQEPTDAYTVNGTTLTMSAAPASAINFYVLHIAGTVESSVVPADGTITSAKLAPGAVSTSFSSLTDTTVNTGDPTATSNKTPVGHVWVNSTSGESYVLTDATTGANVWKNIGDGTGGVPYDIEYLVVAGGGGGGGGSSGGSSGAGGGAGGMRTGTLQATLGSAMTVTVGGGGTRGAHGNNAGVQGSDSVFGSITSTGGGAGAGAGLTGGNGGSGGGGGYNANAGGSGTTGQGNAGGSGGTNTSNYYTGGGGGGKGAVGGSPGNSSTGGAGGAGLASSITGSSVTYAGGGGGGCYAGSRGPGGSGGGATGANSSNNSSSATANTGGGGGGGARQNTSPYGERSSSAGGSGVVVLKVETVNYTGTTTGSPTVTTDGDYTILTYTSSGTYTG